MVDPVPLQQPITELTTKTLASLTRVWINWFNSIYSTLKNVQFYNVEQIYAPNATGFSFQIPSNIGTLLMTPVAGYAAGSLILPANPVNRQRIEVSTSQTVTALTVTAAATILNAPTTLTAGSGFAYLYRSSDTTWHRLY